MQGSVRKKGNRWYYSFEIGSVDGKRKRVERSGGNTKKEALEALRRAILEFETDGQVFAVSDISVSDYFDYWYANYVLINCKLNTQKCYERLINNHIKPALGNYKLKQLTTEKLQMFINLKYRNGFSKSYLSGLAGILNLAFKMALYPYKLLKNNPMIYVILPQYNAPKKKNVTITLADFNRIIERFPYGNHFHMPLQIAFATGMRASEVTGLTWDDINLKDKTISVNKILIQDRNKDWIFSTPKTKSSIRVITIGDSLVNLLKNWYNTQSENKIKYGLYYTNNEFVCTKEDGSFLTPDSLKYISKIVNYELMIRFNFHSLRHTHATMLLENGAHIKAIQTRLGHSRISTTLDVYSHVTEKMNTATVDIFENIVNPNSSENKKTSDTN